MYKKAHVISDFRKKVSPQLGLEPTNMRQNLKKSVSNMIECDVNVLSFGSDFREMRVGGAIRPFNPIPTRLGHVTLI